MADLGPGFKETMYQQAYRLELNDAGLSFECEKPILVPYRSWQIPGQRIDLIVQNIFCRKPTAEETKSLEEYLGKRSDRLPEAYRQMIWALITSSEFRFNY